ncbi:MAG: S4 domain-containing protein [Thermoanaerobaculia bacterium]|nr:S4 domain-containing protein [Thermoanaerobaculia bacterium]
MTVRLDKWLQVARVFRTRTKATKACAAGRVRVNDTVAKPHRPLALGDRVETEFGDWSRILIVRELADRPLPKAEAARLFEDVSPPRPKLDPIERAARRGPGQRRRGAGRPTKRERREIDRWRGR